MDTHLGNFAAQGLYTWYIAFGSEQTGSTTAFAESGCCSRTSSFKYTMLSTTLWVEPTFGMIHAWTNSKRIAAAMTESSL